MFQLMKVTGQSLSPSFQEGDFVLILNSPLCLRSLKRGDTIVFSHPIYGKMIKRLDSLSPDSDLVFVIGTHPDSTDSRHFGPVPRADLLGKVIWHFKALIPGDH
jgi:nickel-type superoxide dismutase maturation protease